MSSRMIYPPHLYERDLLTFAKGLLWVDQINLTERHSMIRVVLF